MAINSLALRVPNNPPDFEGLRLARESLAATEAAWGKDHRETAVVLSNLGNKLREAGQYHESSETLRKALTMMASINGLEHPGTMKTRLRLGLTQIDLGQLAEAVENVNQVIAFRSAREGDTSPGVAEALNGLAKAQIASGEFLAAEATCRKAITLLTNAAGSRQTELALAQRNLAAALKGQRRLNEAEPLLLSAYHSLAIEPSMHLRDLMDLERQLDDLYGRMHAVQPTLGFDTKAEMWRERLSSRRRNGQPKGP